MQENRIQKLMSIIVIIAQFFATSTIKAQNVTESPYALFGDNSEMLDACKQIDKSLYCVRINANSDTTYFAEFDFKTGLATLRNRAGEVILQDSINENTRARFTSIDPHAENYYHLSPYSYCGGNPINAIDPDGQDIYMLFYTTGNERGDEMFKAAETRKYDIEHSKGFDSSNDIVLLCGIQDISSIETLVSSVIETYGESFGKTSEFSIWSHAGKDGPRGTVPTSKNALDRKQMTLEGWSGIDFNWSAEANANFYGCKTGVGDMSNPSFSTKISSLSNYRNVNVHGQTSSAYPSVYTDIRQNNQDMLGGRFSYPTYMVGGGSLGVVGRFFPTYSQANPMRTSRNGKGVVNNYYQPGIRH